MAWKVFFKRGIESFKQYRYEEALKAFDQATCENDKDVALLDSRAAVLEKLNRPLEALKDSKKVIDLKPTSWQGYARSARLFLNINKPGASLKMADLALERLKTGDKKRRAELETLREQAAQALEPPPCYFLKLPMELQTEIFTLVIGDSNARMLALTRICRSWRDIIIHNPRFWRNLAVTPKTGLKKADTWLQRSSGTLSTLRITEKFSYDRIFKNAASTMWSTLDNLKINAQKGGSFAMLPPGAVEQLQLLSLELDFEDLYPDSLQALCKMNGSRTRQLALKVKHNPITMANFKFTTLTSLVLSASFAGEDLFLFLMRNPMLEILALKSPSSMVYELPDDFERLELVNLRLLEFTQFSYIVHCLRNIRLPNVKMLLIDRATGPTGIRSLEAIDTQHFACLEHLTLAFCSLTSATLISVLRTACSLRTLRLPHCSFLQADESFVVDALAETIPAENKQGTSRVVCCPQLQHVDLSGYPHLKAGPVIRFVKAHLSSTTPTDSEPELPHSSDEPLVRPLRILSLNLDDCPMIDPAALPWFRATIPQFSCRMKPVKVGRGMR